MSAKKDNDDRLLKKISLLNSAGGKLAQKGNFKDSALCFNKALDLFGKRGHTFAEHRAGVLNNLGHVFVAARLWDNALDAFTQSANIFKQLEDKTGCAFQLQNLGSVHRDRGDAAKALPYYEKALKLFEECGLVEQVADSHANAAWVLADAGHREEAVSRFQQAFALYGRIGAGHKARLVSQNLAALEAGH
jgi:tetratricopeptide (TPR) repeat protein